MKKKTWLLQVLALLLCAVLLCPMAAFAEEGDAAAEETEEYAVLDPAALQKILDDYCAQNKIDPQKISIGYCYLDTGDTWYYNPDMWTYSASIYKVPLMMILAEREYNGELTRDTDLKGITLGEAEENVLVYSSNDYAHKMLAVLGTDKEARAMYRQFSDLPESYYDPDFLDYSYFTARFTTDVMKTLYYENERFPNILECLMRANPQDYFRGALKGEYEVAQKYGSFTDRRGMPFNHTTGIIYTPHPYLLTVMTQGIGISQDVLRELCVLYTEYNLSLDEAYDAWELAQQEAAQTAEEPEPSEETQKPADEEIVVETEQTAETGEKPAETAAALPVAAEQNRAVTLRLMTIFFGCVLIVILILGMLIRRSLRRKPARYEVTE